LAALELLQTRGKMSGAELARTLEVDRRTVRRYIALLEEIGVPITADLGRHGGYELVAGYKLPPMMFTNDEALALSLGLVAARGLGLDDGGRAAVSAQAKLERVMPAKIQARVRALDETVSLGGSHGMSREINSTLTTLTAAAYGKRGTSMTYRLASGEMSIREFDPYGLVHRGGRWYAVGHCHTRKGLRSFRLDRVVDVTLEDRPFLRPEGFDAFQYLNRSLATMPRAHSVEVWLETDLESAHRELFPTFGVLEPCDGGVLLHAQADDLEWFSRELARLPWPFVIRYPAELKDAMAGHATRILAQI
jgi:predicted DNA-binding transcriptional regulator YafY